LRPAWIEVNLSAVADNVHNLKSVLSPHQQIIAVVKANAYGHGLLPVSRVALHAGATRLALALPEEALALREDGCTAPLLCLSATAHDAAPLVVEQRIEVPVTDLEGAAALAEAAHALGQTALVHLKVDTGMHRLGVPAAEVGDFCRQLRAFPQLQFVGIFTHFSSSATDPEFTFHQLKLFKEAIAEAEAALETRIPIRHTSNSAATVRYPEAWLDAVRPGALIFGIPRDRGGLYLPVMRPVLSLKARLVALQRVPAGEAVGYDRTWVAPRDSRIALLPLGYADGWDRHLSNVGEVLLHGRRAPLVGRICMDATMVDVTDIPEAAVGDTAVLIGDQEEDSIQVHDIARLSDTVVQEVVSRLSPRLPRLYYAEPGDPRIPEALGENGEILTHAPLL